jgi:hypothetical protein
MQTMTAYVRMRAADWTILLVDAEELERKGAISRDYDCEQNTRDNGFPDEGPCYGVNGEEDSDEEMYTAATLDKMARYAR